MVSAEIAQRRAADRWFLERGLPAVLRPGALLRRLWPRSAPALAAFAVFMANSILVVAISGKHTIDINGHPTRNEWFVLGLLILVAPVAAVVGWRVSRITSVSTRTLVATASVLVVIASGFLGGPSERVLANLVVEGIVIVAALVLTACGVGSILGWALRTAADNLAFVGALFVRALPVVLLTVLVFFNTYVWSMASTVSRPRLWLALLFLGLIAVAFITSATIGTRCGRCWRAPSTPPTTTDVWPAPRSSRCPIPRPRSRCPGPSASTWFSSLVDLAGASGRDGGHRRRPHLLRARPDPAEPGTAGAVDAQRLERRRDPRYDAAGTAGADSDRHVPLCDDIHVRQRAGGRRRATTGPGSSTRSSTTCV